MSDTWLKIKSLVGETLETLAPKQKRPFTITEVNDRNIKFINSKGNKRQVTRKTLEHIVAQDWSKSELSRKRIEEIFPSDRNTSYIAAILLEAMKP